MSVAAALADSFLAPTSVGVNTEGQNTPFPRGKSLASNFNCATPWGRHQACPDKKPLSSGSVTVKVITANNPDDIHDIHVLRCACHPGLRTRCGANAGSNDVTFDVGTGMTCYLVVGDFVLRVSCP